MDFSHAMHGLAVALAQADKAWHEQALHGQFRHSVMQEPAAAAAAAGLLFSSQAGDQKAVPCRSGHGCL